MGQASFGSPVLYAVRHAEPLDFAMKECRLEEIVDNGRINQTATSYVN